MVSGAAMEDGGDWVVARRVRAIGAVLDGIAAQADTVIQAAAAVAERTRAGGTVMSLGNGGSAALADHFSAELTGRLRADRERAPLAAFSLTADAATMTAIANDYGFDDVFARQLQGRSQAKDVVVFFSTSGRSANLLTADRVARERGLLRIAFLGAAAGPLDNADMVLRVSATDPGTVQEGHLLLLHALAEEIENASARDVYPVSRAADEGS